MRRRNLFAAVLGATGALAANALRGSPARAAPTGTPKVVYHLADLDKVAFVLNNIHNHFAGMGGPDGVTIALVVHGPALKAFHTEGASHEIKARADALHKSGAAFHACLNTMRSQKVTLAGLLPGFIVAEKGGVVLLTELQLQGYAYLRP